MNSDPSTVAIEESMTVETISIFDSNDETMVSSNDSNENSSSNNHNNNHNNSMLNEALLPSSNNVNSSETSNSNSNSNSNIRHVKSKITACFTSIFQIYADQSGSCLNLTKGLSLAALAGIILGLIIPKNPNLPSPVYQYISSIIGYTYFVAWSVSFYPQIITNYKRKKIDGLSVDASILAVLNYICYTIYTSFFFWDETIREEYKERNGEDAEVTVMSNDVAFAVNSLLLTSITLGQVFYYDGLKDQPVSRLCKGIVLLTVGISLVNIVCILCKVPGFLWIDFLYMMGTIKLILTIMTYVPQIYLNFRRRSTEGFNIWNVIFDFSGGLLSLTQLYFDCLDMNDFSGILGNWAKLVLSLITLVFDGIMFLQHYVLFRSNVTSSTSSSTLNGETSEDEALYTPLVEIDENGEEILTEFV